MRRRGTAQVSVTLALISLSVVCFDQCRAAKLCKPNMEFQTLGENGEAFVKAKNYRSAQTCFELAVKQGPLHHFAWVELAQIYSAREKFRKSRDAYIKAIETDVQGNWARGHFFVGETSLKIKEYDVAERYLRRSQQIEVHAVTGLRLAEVLWIRNKRDEALNVFESAIKQNRRFSELHIGRFLPITGRPDLHRFVLTQKTNERCLDTRQYFRDEAERYSNDCEVQLTIGFLSLDNLKLADVVAARALKLCPNNALSFLLLGMIANERDEHKAAIRQLRRAVAIDNSIEEAHGHLGSALLGENRLGAYAESLKHLNIALELGYKAAADIPGESSKMIAGKLWRRRRLELNNVACQWKDRHIEDEWYRNLTMEQLDKGASPPPFPPLHAQQMGLGPPELLSRLIQAMAGAVADEAVGYTPAGWLGFDHSPILLSPVDKRITIGYISADLLNHPVGHNVWFHRHDIQKFRVIVFAVHHQGREWDHITETIRSRAGSDFYEVSSALSSFEIAATVNTKRPHVLVSISGWSARNQMASLSLSPAPIQFNVMGSHISSGTDKWLDTVGDRIATPPEFTKLYPEKMLYMPFSFFGNEYSQSRGDVVKRPAVSRKVAGVPSKGRLIASAGNSGAMARLDPESFGLWTEVLKGATSSHLLLFASEASYQINRDNLRAYVRDAGVDPNRLVFTEPIPSRIEHLRHKMVADFAVDRLHYNGHTTSTDFLWPAVPVVTAPLIDYCARVTASLVMAVMPGGDTIVRNGADFIALATTLAQSNSSRHIGSLKSKLRVAQKESPLWDTVRWVRDLETSMRMRYELLWSQRGLRAHVVVARRAFELDEPSRDATSTTPASTATSTTTAMNTTTAMSTTTPTTNTRNDETTGVDGDEDINENIIRNIKVEDMNVTQLCVWLRAIGFSKPVALIAENEFCGEDLLDLSDDDMTQHLGMQPLAIKKLRNRAKKHNLEIAV